MEIKKKEKDTVVGISDFFYIHGIQDINVRDASTCITKSFMRSSKNITKLCTCTLQSTSKTVAGFGHFLKFV